MQERSFVPHNLMQVLYILQQSVGGGDTHTTIESSEKKDRGGREKTLDIWLLEFNKTLKERHSDKPEVAGK